MPKSFDTCVKSGGKVRTKKLKDDKYMHLCFKNNNSYAGNVKRKKSGNGRGR